MTYKYLSYLAVKWPDVKRCRMKDRRRTNRHQQSAGTQTFLSLSLCLSLPLAALSINTRVESRESEPLVHYLLIQLPSRASPPSCTSGPIPPTVKLESRHGAINGFPSRSTRPLCLVLVVIICTAVLNWFQYVSLFFQWSFPFRLWLMRVLGCDLHDNSTIRFHPRCIQTTSR